MIKIVHLIVGLNVGGAEMMLYKLLSATDRQEFEPYVISLTTAGPLAKNIRELNIPVYALEMSKGFSTVIGMVQLAKLLSRLKPNILQTWMYHADLIGGIVGKLIGIPTIIWNIRQSNLQYSKKSTKLIAKLCAYLSPYIPSQIISCSLTAKHYHKELGYKEELFNIIPNGFDLNRFKPNKRSHKLLCEQLNIPANAFLIGMIANYMPDKDHQNFVQAAAYLKQALGDEQTPYFVLGGRGLDSQNSSLMEMLHGKHILDKTFLLGYRADMPFLISALDVVTLSSKQEGFPNVIGEAMACGIPCVVTDTGDCKAIVEIGRAHV